MNGFNGRPSMIRLCYIVCNLNPGGLERVVVNFLNNMDRSKFKLHLVCLDKSGFLLDQIRMDDIDYTVLHRRGGLDFRTLMKLRHYLIKEKIDIVHGHNYMPLVFGGIAAKLIWNGPKVIYTEHNQIYRASPSRRKMFKWFIKNADVFLTVSDDLKRYCEQLTRTKKSIQVLYNGIDGTVYKKVNADRIKKELHIKEGERIIGTAVVISKQKAIHYMLDAFSYVCKERNDTTLVIAGDGPLRSEMIQYAERCGLSDKVIFLGYRRDVPELMSLYEIFLLSSLWEGHPLCLLEALAVGTPIVATDVGGCAEVVEDSVNGYIVPTKKPSIFAEKILAILGDASLREKMSLANRDRFHKHFSLEAMVQNHENMYTSALKERRWSM